MIDRIIEASLRQRFLVLCGTLLLVALGIRAVYRTPIDAIPDLSENQVIVFADWPGRGAQEVEDQITYPLSANLQGLAGVRSVRATSMTGFSLITVLFEDSIDNYFARTRVLERLNQFSGSLPGGVVPQLGPDASGLGWVYQYSLEVDPAKAPGGGYDLGRLRSIQDWLVRYPLQAIPGVAEVASIGGFVRQYQIEVSSAKLRAVGVPLGRVVEAVSKANLNVGGKVIEENGREYVVRGVGLVKGPEDLEKVVLSESNGVPVLLRDVAHVRLGGDFRRGSLDVDGEERVGGVVVMRTGENAREVIRRVRERIAQIEPSLPPGISLRAFYDRSDLIDRTLDTLRHALWEEVILVTLAHILFLWHFRSILIVTLPLPLSILTAFLLMERFGISSNIMSLTGIAIAIGVLVDAAIVMTENVIRHAEEAEDARRRAGLDPRLTPAETLRVTLEASRQVGRPVFFAMAIIILAFVPVFALTGQEGKLFHPLAFTKTFAMVGSTFLAMTMVPVLCSFLVRGPFRRESDHWLMRGLLRIYDPLLGLALEWRKTVLAGAVLILAAALVLALGLPRNWVARLESAGWPTTARLARGMGSEFMPPLNEGSLLFMPVLLPGTSLTEVKEIMSWQDRVMRSFPEVQSVAGKLGRFETATDPAPVEMIETTITLKPEWISTNRLVLGFLPVPAMVRNPEWRPGVTARDLIHEMSQRLSEVPGYVPGFLQPIENRILMLSTGIRAQLGIKVFGDSLDDLQRKAFEIERIVRTIPGAVGVAASRVQGKPYVEIEVDRMQAARFGLNVRDVLDVVETGIGGAGVGTAIEGRARLPIQVRLEASERDDIDRLGDLLVPTANGTPVPLALLATIHRTDGPGEIASENGRLRVYVQANVQGRDLGSFVSEVKERMDREVIPHLPGGMTLDYSGEFENQLRAARTLRQIVPMVLGIIFVLLYLVYRSAVEAAHVLLAVPFALSGGVFLQWALGWNFSVAVWVGYIALFGTAIQTGVVMVVYLEETLAARRAALGDRFGGADLVQAIREGARLRLRPKVMTVATIVASLLPIFWSHRTGVEVMQPLATPVIGGMVSSLLHILIVTPVIFLMIREREFRGR
ncbi:MAG: efflux RND transporter permease subunit [Verrucomicrobia bacterium]|nr:efflux RND transporter permease subunit [Verrucomicrobiota bacterium]